MNLRTEKEVLIDDLNRANKLAEEATLDYMNMCKEVEVLEKCVNDIEEICKKSWHDSGITIDYFKRNNYSWKQHQIRSLISRFEQILQKIKQAKEDKNEI